MVKSIDIIKFLDLECINKKSFKIEFVKPPDDLQLFSFTLLTIPSEFDLLFENVFENVLAIIPKKLQAAARLKKATFLLSDNPRLDYVKALNKFFVIKRKPNISETAIINTNKTVHKSVWIGENVIIKGSVEIDEESVIYDNVVINGNVKIGKNVKIKSGSIIGLKGFNFVYDENNIPIEFPHFGSVIIGDNVEIGALNTVVQGTLGDTIILDNVKTDDHVHIAHNVIIGTGTLITACAEISGSVKIGNNTWLGPNCSIIDHVSIGNNVIIGIGAVVTKSFQDSVVVVGNPARILKNR